MSTASPFDAESKIYDDVFSQSLIGRLARGRFWRAADGIIPPGARILDLGGGTGEDACHFAERGGRVVLTDASEGMLETARTKIRARGLEDRVEARTLDMNRMAESGYLAEALGAEIFDAAYANFGAINCVQDLAAFAKAVAPVLRPGAPLLLTVMGPWVPWEWLWFGGRGQFGKAFRRLSREGTVWRGLVVRYPSPDTLSRALAPSFEPIETRVINAFVPPSYMEGFVQRRVGLVHALDRQDERFVTSRVLIHLADHYLAQFRRT